MANDSDWYPPTRAGQRLMFQNVDVKIDSYKGKYSLSNDYLDKVHAACLTFIEGYDKLEQNRATAKQMTSWFENILTGEPAGEPASNPPGFQTVNLPAGAFIGIEDVFRELMGFFKANPVYDKADGENLMIVATQADSKDLADVAPVLKLDATIGNLVTVEWVKSGFTALELQYRKAGTDMWQAADKSTEKIIEFAPPITTPGVPEKFEFRAVFLQKNVRVGEWSAIYPITVG